MISRTVRKIAIVAGLTLAVSGCFGREQPVYNVSDHQIPTVSKPLSVADVQKNIILAGSERGWRFTPVEPGHLKGHIDDDGHSADIDVRFTSATYSIRYVSSSNLLATSTGTIHRSYNHWVHNLEADIDHQIVKASYQ